MYTMYAMFVKTLLTSLIGLFVVSGILLGEDSDTRCHVDVVDSSDTKQLIELERQLVDAQKRMEAFDKYIRDKHKMSASDSFSDDYRFVIRTPKTPQVEGLLHAWKIGPGTIESIPTVTND